MVSGGRAKPKNFYLLVSGWAHTMMFTMMFTMLFTQAFAHDDVHDTLNLQDQFAKFANFDKNGEERKLWWTKYRNAKSQCSWQEDLETLAYKYDWFPTDEKMRGSYWSYLSSQMWITTYYPDLPLLSKLFHFLFGPAARDMDLQSYRCRLADSDDGEWRIRRLGPFVGNGGFDWHKMKLEDPYNLRSEIGQGTVHMSGFMALAVDEDGEILGNPPIHIHHANLGQNPNTSSLARISQWHGDSQCADSDGGTACYITVLPPGFGFPVSEALRLDIDFNDLRPAQSPDMRFWLETAIRITKKPMHEIGTVILGVPFRAHWWNTADLQRLYFVPSDQHSVLWMTARMPTAGTFVKGKLETHQHMFDEAWVFSGTSPEDLGLNSKLWALRKPWLPWLPKENGWTDDTVAIQALKSDVNSHFEKLVQHCAEDLSCKKPPSLVWTLNRTVFEDGEEREMPWPEKTWTFDHDEQFTIVIFHKAMAMPGVEPKELSQHLAITGHYIPEAETDAEYIFVLPSINADSAWINSVNWYLALTHTGAPPIVGFWSVMGAVVVFGFLVQSSAAVWCVVTLFKRLKSIAFKNRSRKNRFVKIPSIKETNGDIIEETEIIGHSFADDLENTSQPAAGKHWTTVKQRSNEKPPPSE